MKTGSRVKAGQLIAYNGDSGDAEGTYHLHFEVHPHDGIDVNPRPYLNDARRILFPLPDKPARQVKLGLKGTVVAAGGGVVEMAGHGRAGLAGRSMDGDPGPPARARSADGRGARRLARRSDHVSDEADSQQPKGNKGDRVHHPHGRNTRRHVGRARSARRRSDSPRVSGSRSELARGRYVA